MKKYMLCYVARVQNRECIMDGQTEIVWLDTYEEEIHGRAFIDQEHGITEKDIVEIESQLLEQKREDYSLNKSIEITELVVTSVSELYG